LYSEGSAKCVSFTVCRNRQPLSASSNTEFNSVGNTVSSVVDILHSPEEATKMLCPEESFRLSMIILMIYSSNKD